MKEGKEKESITSINMEEEPVVESNPETEPNPTPVVLERMDKNMTVIVSIYYTVMTKIYWLKVIYP